MIEHHTVRSARSSPSRAATPGRKLSTTTSALAHERPRPISGSALRSQKTDSLPAFSAASHAGAAVRKRIAVRRLEPHHARAEPQQLARRVRPGEEPGEVDDEETRERLHRRRLLLTTLGTVD